MPSNDLTLYSTYASEWWTPGAPRFRSLQNITPFRLTLLNEFLGDVAGKTVYDIGCGGGLISVPLLKKGALLTGLDVSAESIEAAREASGGEGHFIVGDARAVPLPSHSADIVLLMDLVDHIEDYPKALQEAARLVKPGGTVVAGTINRTWKSWIGAIFLGEGLRLIPPGTHKHSMFVTPKELEQAAIDAGLIHVRTQGERVLIGTTLRRWAITLERGDSCKMAYTMVFKPTSA